MPNALTYTMLVLQISWVLETIGESYSLYFKRSRLSSFVGIIGTKVGINVDGKADEIVLHDSLPEYLTLLLVGFGQYQSLA